MQNNIPAWHFSHYDENSAFDKRIELIKKIIFHYKRAPWIRILTLDILKPLPADLPRYEYDYVAAGTIFKWFRSHVPFRKDINKVETIQTPDVTLKYGGDCDCLCGAAGSVLESAGIPVTLAVSKSFSNMYDHVFIFLKTLPREIPKVFDLTNPGPFPRCVLEYPDAIEV